MPHLTPNENTSIYQYYPVRPPSVVSQSVELTQQQQRKQQESQMQPQPQKPQPRQTQPEREVQQYRHAIPTPTDKQQQPGPPPFQHRPHSVPKPTQTPSELNIDMNLLSHDERIRRAVLCVRDALSFRWPVLHTKSPKQARIYAFYSSTAYWVLGVSLSWGLMALVLWEPEQSWTTSAGAGYYDDSQSGKHYAIATAELVCIIFLVADVLLRMSVSGVSVFLHHRYNVAHLSVLTIMMFDIVLNIVSPGLTIRFGRPLRPFTLAYFNPPLRRMISFVGVTLTRALDVLLFLFLLVVFYGVAGTNLYKGLYVDESTGEDLPLGNFQSVTGAFLSLFVLLSTENYPDIMYPALRDSEWNFIFFFTFLLLGMFLITNALIAAYYDAHKDRVKDHYSRRLLRQWTSLTMAFEYLDMSQDGMLDLTEWRELVASMRPRFSDDVVLFLFELVDVGRSGHITLPEFLKFGDVMLMRVSAGRDGKQGALSLAAWRDSGASCWRCVRRRVSRCESKRMKKRRQWLETIVESRTFQFIIMALIVANTVVIIVQTSESVSDDVRHTLAVVDWILLGIFAVEIGLRIIAHGIFDFWGSFWNSLDFFLIFACIILQVIVLRSDDDDDESDGASWAIPGRFARVSKVGRVLTGVRLGRSFRIVSSTARMRVLFLTIVRVIPIFLRLSLIMFLLMYSFAVAGMELFAGKFDTARDKGVYENEFADFDTFPRALLTLFQVTTTSNWHEIMYAGSISRPGLGSSWFFVIFYFVAVLVLFNLLISLIIDIYSKFSQEELNAVTRVRWRKKGECRRPPSSSRPGASEIAGGVAGGASESGSDKDEHRVINVKQKRTWIMQFLAEDISEIREETFKSFVRLSKESRRLKRQRTAGGEEGGTVRPPGKATTPHGSLVASPLQSFHRLDVEHMRRNVKGFRIELPSSCGESSSPNGTGAVERQPSIDSESEFGRAYMEETEAVHALTSPYNMHSVSLLESLAADRGLIEDEVDPAAEGEIMVRSPNGLFDDTSDLRIKGDSRLGVVTRDVPGEEEVFVPDTVTGRTAAGYALKLVPTERHAMRRASDLNAMLVNNLRKAQKAKVERRRKMLEQQRGERTAIGSHKGLRDVSVASVSRKRDSTSVPPMQAAGTSLMPAPGASLARDEATLEIWI